METSSLTLAPGPDVPAASSAATNCVSCGTALAGAYCHACGEKQLHRHDYALKHFLEHTIDTITHFDLRVLRDLWWQLRRPGFLAAEWLQGRRVRHAPPVQLFLITNLLFFLLASISHFSPFETQLRYHFSGTNGYGSFAQRLVQQHLQHAGISYPEFARHFDALAHGYSKSLVFLFIPLLMAPLCLLFWRQRRYFVEWIMLSTFLFAGILLLFAATALFAFFLKVSPTLAQIMNHDDVWALIMIALTTSYVAAFFKGAFPSQTGLLRWSKALAFTFAFSVALVVPYRFVLFLVCYWAAS